MILAAGVAGAQEIHLKARDINTTSTTTDTSSVSARAVARPTRNRANAAGPVHQIVQFGHTPGVDDIEALMAAGYTVIGAVPDNALMVVARGGVAAPAAGARWTGELEASDKISAALENEAGTVSAVVEFHPDVAAGSLQAIGAAAGVTLDHPAGLLANHMIASATVAQLRVLAESDEVAYIFPADPALIIGNEGGNESGNELMPCAGMLTTGGTIGQYANIVHGWDLDSGNAAHLGYFFGALTPKVPASTVQSEILRALNTWSAVTNVVFSPAASATAVRTIMIEFASGAHGDAFPFDNAGEVLAHTFYPVPLNSESVAGDMHLNESVNWHSGSDIDVYSVALHELGHALGLGHTDTPGDVMYPYYRHGMQLSVHDIGAVQTLYGAPGTAPVQTGAITVSPTPAAPSKTAPAPATAAPTPVSLILNAIASPGTAAQVSISGTVTGGAAPLTISWQTDHGYSGKATVAANGTWTATGVALVAGANTVTATVFDSANKTASEAAMVTRQQASPTTSAGPMSIHITSPSSAVVTQTGTTVSLSGTATGGVGVTKVTWQTSGGASGTATGVGPWVALNIPLLIGSNTIIVKAFDTGTASAWASIVVVRH
jgi:Matrixin/Bacterial Ig domain